MNRRSLVVALAAVVCLAATGRTAPQEPRVEDIVAKNLAALGGVERLKAVNTIKKVARLISPTMPGGGGNTTMYLKRPNLLRQETEVNGQKVINGFDGKVPWLINPLLGMRTPLTLSGPQADRIREESTFDPMLLDYRQRFYTVDYASLDREGERQFHRLRITSPSRQVSHLYIDAATFLEARLTTDVDRTRLEVVFEDYRDVNGLKFSFVQRQIVNGVQQGEMRFESIETNVPMNDSLFRIPKD